MLTTVTTLNYLDLSKKQCHTLKLVESNPLATQTREIEKSYQLKTSFAGPLHFWYAHKLFYSCHVLEGSAQFGGFIPVDLGKLTALTYLDLSYNLLSGSVPSSFASLSRLRK